MLELRHLSKVYPNGTAALQDFTLNVANGEAVAIIGGSGCGKSTLLRLIAGLEQPTKGDVLVDGERITQPHPAVGLVFQEPRLLPWLTVGDNVGFGLEGVPAAERQRRIHDALESVGLAEQAGKWPREMSGGMAQRVALARALVTGPSVLLLDEPFSALDALTRASLQDHLVRLWQDSRPTLLLVTHDIEEALVIANRVIVVRPRPGRIDAVFDVSLPHPRDRDAEDFESLKHELRGALDRSLRDQNRAAG
ncbi:MAG: ABC transporter ATP-binding protein [Mesorhizobium sp.]|nr:ABC transporter ATP-binding protein [Mesorhizobium sp.]MBL8580249.1 ABC transporter ATP-binding protein [Mesorhizobium sp.]